MKKCAQCGLEKPIDEFGSNKCCKDGKSVYCIDCANARARDSYQKQNGTQIFKECQECHIIKDLILFYKLHGSGDGRCDICMECYDKNNTTSSNGGWADRHKKYRLNYHKEYRKNNQETCIKGRILTGSRRRASDKGIEFDLDKEWVDSHVYSGLCEVTGLPFIYNGHSPFTPSIDRIDSSKGYTKDNCRIVCKLYNFAKNIFSDDDVMLLSRALVKRR